MSEESHDAGMTCCEGRGGGEHTVQLCTGIRGSTGNVVLQPEVGAGGGCSKAVSLTWKKAALICVLA
jgi:hypothetical protein